MAKAVLDISMSLDGFIAGPNISAQHPLGEGGLHLHDWFFGAKTPTDESIMQQHIASTGAVILGGRTYRDAINDEWGGATPFHTHAFVLTHASPKVVVDGFTFVTDGIESALRQAAAVAGDKSVWMMGGANVLQQYLNAGLVDEIQLHIAPLLLGGGTRLFDNLDTLSASLETTRVIETPAATHVRYRVLKQQE
jgi:dihydrofolate reductase